MDTKKAIRRRFLDVRRNLSPQEVADRSRLIAERLRALELFQRADTCLCYVSSKDNEVDTHDLIRSLLAEGETVLVPVTERDATLLWSRLLKIEEVQPSRFGILEPRPECRRPTPPPQDAVVVIPGIAFTRDGYRVGYGGGYYDRFLATHVGPKIGLAFEVQLAPSLERSPHDMPVDAVVTEAATYWRRRTEYQ